MIVKIYDNAPNSKDVAAVVDRLNRGGIVILPTDTIYSIVCTMSNRKGFETLCKIKDLTIKSSDFSILCASLSDMSNYTRPISNQLFRLLKRNLPGPFTFILEANNAIPKLFGTRRKTIGVRVPDNAIFNAIADLLDEPLIGTSIHDDDDVIEYTTDPSLIYEKYHHQIDLMVDGGYGQNMASTVVDCVEMPPLIIRQGIGELID
jgi:tRNA threonylcarbamoyl adenosine modification protein (Sua5/YciO/YrdC/YwlC family)